MYVDDTTLYFNLEHFPVLNRQISITNEIEQVNICLKINKVTMNTDKTKCMLFYKRKNIDQIDLYIDNKLINIIDIAF